jgi:hypothetical protein
MCSSRTEADIEYAVPNFQGICGKSAATRAYNCVSRFSFRIFFAVPPSHCDAIHQRQLKESASIFMNVYFDVIEVMLGVFGALEELLLDL